MRLSAFILENIEPILLEWEAFARSLLPGAGMTVAELRDDAESILRATARDMQSAQSLEQQANKSRGAGGAGGETSDRLDAASDMHGLDRVASGFHITEVVSEYRALRASVLRLWRETLPQSDLNDIDDITRFNEALDQSLARGVGSYSKRIDDSRQMFLAILGHDLRNPLSITRTSAYLVSLNHEDRGTTEALAMINRSTDGMERLIGDLIDFSSSALGHKMPLNREPIDMTILCREVIDAYRTTHADRVLRLRSHGDTQGVWDAGRIRQVLSNLIGNALQHGAPDAPIDIALTSETSSPASGSDSDSVVLSVRNACPPIPPELLPTLFDPLKRYATRESAAQRTAGSIGLGLYIVREIVAGHRGTVSVASTADQGTTFTVRLPRCLPAEDSDRDDPEATR